MNTRRRTAIIAGLLFLIAMVASLAGGALVEGAVAASDLPVAISDKKAQLILGLILELINALAVLGIGLMLFPVLHDYNANMARGYLGFRIVEAVFCSAVVIGPLALMNLSESPQYAAALNSASVEGVRALAMAQRESIASLLIPLYFCIGALLLYSSLYGAKLLPRYISIWGFVAAILALTLNLAMLFVEVPIWASLVFVLPIILNEIFLGFWLVIKGFNPAVNIASTGPGL